MEDPEKHDFDQRHDGPLPSPTGTKSTTALDTEKAAKEDGFATAPTSPTEPAPITRKSFQGGRRGSEKGMDRTASGENPPRKSTQMSRQHGAPRPSRDFDNRYDGPFSRPSLAMSRRRSSHNAGHERTHSESHPAVPNLPTEELDEHGNPIAPDPDSLVQTPSGYEPEPPPLNYSVWDRKYFTFFFWFLICVDCIAMPLALYFGLWYHTSLSPNAVFSIVTAALGGVSIVEYFLRSIRLFKKTSTCRPLGSTNKWHFDFFHWNFTLGWVVVMLELIIGTCPRNPPIRLLAMPPASMLYVFGTELLFVDTLRLFKVPAPFRISSMPKGTQLRPCIYSIIEDVVAVDGSGGEEYREALNRRYEASHVFRAMLRRLGLFWAVSAEAMAVLLTILIFTLSGEAAYVIGWTVPFVWGGIWALLTYIYVVYMLRKEKKAWAEELAEKMARA